MENNFYVGVIHYGRRPFKQKRKETLILYSDDNINYLDLRSGIYYTTDKINRDYVEKESIVPTDIYQYREDYQYMLDRCREKCYIRKK